MTYRELTLEELAAAGQKAAYLLDLKTLREFTEKWFGNADSVFIEVESDYDDEGNSGLTVLSFEAFGPDGKELPFKEGMNPTEELGKDAPADEIADEWLEERALLPYVFLEKGEVDLKELPPFPPRVFIEEVE